LAFAAIITSCYLSFRDYEVLNHGLLQTLVEKVRLLEENAGRRALEENASESEESLRDYSWIFDELADEVDSKMDPTYILAAGAIASYSKAQRNRLGGGDRRELHHDSRSPSPVGTICGQGNRQWGSGVFSSGEGRCR